MLSLFRSAVLLSSLLAVGGCATSSDYKEPGPVPVVTKVTAASNLTCKSKESGGACPLSISLSFRLPQDQFVWKAFVRFQADGSDVGTDRVYLLDTTYGADATEVSVTINAIIPPNLVPSEGTELCTYSVRLLTGAGDESTPSKLTVSVVGNASSS